jgi:hypothetical protein
MLRQLPVVFDFRALVTGGRTAIRPFGRVQDFATLAHLFFSQKIGNLHQHNFSFALPSAGGLSAAIR